MLFRVDLDVFRGPLDLLLYLVRKHEVDVIDIPISPIADQFLNHLAVLEDLDVGEVGEFVAMASWLIEIKSRMVLPHADEVDEEMEDPRQELVQRLLEYKKFKDAASVLEERGVRWQERFCRAADDDPLKRRDLAEEPIREVELWDLVSALGRILRDTQIAPASNIVYDDTPIHVHMQRIYENLVAERRLAYTKFFKAGMHKSTMIGVFLATLELVRHHQVRAEQNALFGEIWLHLPDGAPPSIETAMIDEYEHEQVEANETLPETSSPSPQD